MNITKTQDGYLINDHILLFAEQALESYINLAKNQGWLMSYGQTPIFAIDYPWEYDKNNIDITCFAEPDGILDYKIVDQWEIVAIIQTQKALEFDWFTTVDYWIVPDQSLSEQLTKMELDGKIITLTDLQIPDDLG